MHNDKQEWFTPHHPEPHHHHHHPEPPCPPPPHPPLDNSGLVANLLQKVSALQADIYLIQNYLKNLGLSDLKDVADCMHPLDSHVLTFQNGEWINMANNSHTNVQVIPEVTEGELIATINVDDTQTKIYSKGKDVIVDSSLEEGTEVARITVGDVSTPIFIPPSSHITIDNDEIVPIGGGQYQIALITVDGTEYRLLGHDTITNVGGLLPEGPNTISIGHVLQGGVMSNINIPDSYTKAEVDALLANLDKGLANVEVVYPGPTKAESDKILIASIKVTDGDGAVTEYPLETPKFISAFTNDAGYIQGIKINGESVPAGDDNYVDIKITEPELSQDYESRSDLDENLALQPGDTYEEAFAKIEGTIEKNEAVTAAALNDLEQRKANKEDLSAVAFSGSYNDLADTPVIPDEFHQQQVDWNAVSGVTSILNKPTLATVATSGDYNDLGNKPSLATVATSGNYNDLESKPNLASVAISGDYNDLESKPNLAAVATSGSYNDLSDKPDVEQADWNEADASSAAFIKNKPSNLGVIDNVKVNDIVGTVNDRVAVVPLTGADIAVTGFEESTEHNDDLNIAPTDTINEALGKMQKAWKDNEAAITRAFFAVATATGFNENLEYVKEQAGTLLENADSLQDADAILMNNLSQLQSDFSTIKNNQVRFSGGTSGLVKFNEIPSGGYNIEIPYEGNCTNITYRFPVATVTSGAEQYWTHALILQYLETQLLPPLIYTGRCITFEVSDKNWEWWQYVGPMSDGIISHSDWLLSTNWKQLNVSYAVQS